MGSLAFLITVPIMGAQFIYASVIHKTFPGFTMPSFAIQEIPADSLLRSIQHKVAGINVVETQSILQWKSTRFRGLHNQWPITYMSLMLGFGFFTAGIIKLLCGWLNPAHSMVYSYFLKNFYIYGLEGILSNVFLQRNWLPFWELQDWMTLFLEIGFLIAIFWPVVYRLFTVLGMVFHVGVLLILRISFLEFVVIYALFCGPVIPDQSFDKWWNKSPKRNLWILTIVAITSGITYFSLGQSSILRWAFIELG